MTLVVIFPLPIISVDDTWELKVASFIEREDLDEMADGPADET